VSQYLHRVGIMLDRFVTVRFYSACYK